MTLRVALLFADGGYDLPGIARQLDGFQVEHLPEAVEWEGERLAQLLRGFDAAVTGRRSPSLPAALVGERGRLRLLAHCHGTIRHLVSKEHIAAGLAVSNWGDAVGGVAEGAMALLFACLKQLHALDARVRSDWKNDRRIWQDFPATLNGRNVGVYGYGPIGRHFVRFLEPFGALPAVYDPYASELPAHVRRCASLRELFATCEIVSVHCGLNDATRGSVTRELLELLPQGGILINTARGGIVDEPALVAVLASGRILAGIDVINDERRWAQGELATLGSDRVILTGHGIGNGKGPAPGTGRERARLLPGFVVKNLHALAEGAPLGNLVTADIYDLKT